MKRQVLFFLASILVFLGYNYSIAAAVPDIKLEKKVTEIKRFDSYSVHPSRYIMSYDKTEAYVPVFYDLETGKTVKWPSLQKLEGLPEQSRYPKSKDDKYYLDGLKLQGKYFRWYEMKVVVYDPEKNRAGVLFIKATPSKFIEGNPECKDSGEKSELIKQYNRYYCRSIKKYVPEEEYMVEKYEFFYASVDPNDGKILSMTPLKLDTSNPNEQPLVHPVGYDAENGYFYYSNLVFMYKNKESSGNIQVYRFNVESKKVDWEMKFNIPVRKKENTSGSYSIKVSANESLSRIVFFEYDESMNEKGKNGWLENPEAQGYVVDTNAKSYFAFQSPLTAYGQAFDQKGERLVMVSNQTGKIHWIDLKTKKQEKVVQGDRSVFHALFTKNNKYLYVFTKTNLAIYSAKDMKLVKKMPIGQYLPGVVMLLAAEDALALNKNSVFLTGNLKKMDGGNWWASDDKDGFLIFKILDE